MRPIGTSRTGTSELLENGVITWPDGKLLMKHGEGYLLRTAECEICFRWFGDIEKYLAFNGASFRHYVIDAEDAKRQRIVRHLAKNVR